MNQIIKKYVFITKGKLPHRKGTFHILENVHSFAQRSSGQFCMVAHATLASILLSSVQHILNSDLNCHPHIIKSNFLNIVMMICIMNNFFLTCFLGEATLLSQPNNNCFYLCKTQKPHTKTWFNEWGSMLYLCSNRILLYFFMDKLEKSIMFLWPVNKPGICFLHTQCCTVCLALVAWYALALLSIVSTLASVNTTTTVTMPAEEVWGQAYSAPSVVWWDHRAVHGMGLFCLSLYGVRSYPEAHTDHNQLAKQKCCPE